ncbi:hypothetical protein LCGC14_1811090, partial [marine sediment metagenome]
MPDNTIPSAEELFRVGRNAASLEQKAERLASIRQQSPELARQIDMMILDRCATLLAGLEEVRANQQELKAILKELAAPPWHPAMFLAAGMTAEGRRALVVHGGSRRVVAINPDMDPEALSKGQEVLLTNELNAIMALSPFGPLAYGETSTFDRWCPDGRMVVTSRDEEFIIDAVDAVADCGLKKNDRIRWDRRAWMAMERIQRARGEDMFLEETPSETFDNIGGLDEQIAELKRIVELHRNHEDVTGKYGLLRRRGVLLVGPPGTGKTMLARAFANWLGQISPSGRSRFINVKPGQLHTKWYAESEANYRKVFALAREAGEAEPQVPV